MYDCYLEGLAEVYNSRVSDICSLLSEYKWENKSGNVVDIRIIDDKYFLNLCSYLKKHFNFSNEYIQTLKEARDDYKKTMI